MAIRLSDHFTYRKLIRFTLPSIAMMIFTSIYSVVDGFFVSNFAGKTAFAAVNLIMPVLIIVATVGFMMGTGGTALVAKTYGEGDKERANSYFSLIVYVSLAFGIVLSLLGFIFTKPIAIAMGADGELLKNCIIYGRINFIALPFFILQVMFQSFFVAAEKPKLGLVITISSGLTNMVLDAVLVLFLPQGLKLVGAATATAIAQLVGGLVPFIYFVRKNDTFLRLGSTSFNGKVLLKACTNGSSEFMSNVSMSLVGVLYNLQLIKYAGENGLAAYGVMMYVSMIFSAAFVGFAIGGSPIISYNQGAENHKEVKGLLKSSLVLIGSFGIVMVLLAEALSSPLANFFVGYDKELSKLTISGFRIFSLSFFFMGYAIYISSFFTALNDGLTSALISFLRTLVFQTASIIILPKRFGIDGIWWSVVVAEMVAFVFSIIFLRVKKQKYKY